jgi:hypothetical protein
VLIPCKHDHRQKLSLSGIPPRTSEKRGKKRIISFKKKRILNEKRGVLFSAFGPIRSIRAEVKMTCR